MKSQRVSIYLSCLAVCAFLGCDDGISALVGIECTPPATKCENGVMQICAVTSWQTQKCPNGCDESGTKCAIAPGSVCAVDVCDEGNKSILKKCVDGKYVPEQCPDDKPICLGMACVFEKCTPGAVKCSHDQKGTLTCNANGDWEAVVACPDGQRCDVAENRCVDEAVVNDCTDKTMKCVTSDSESYFVCKDGKWQSDAQKCDAGKVCKGEDGKAECVDASACEVGAKRCDGDKIAVCGSDGKWGEAVACETEGDICRDGVCGPKPECVAGQTECVGDGIKICGADGKWGNVSDCEAEGETCNPDTQTCQPLAAECEEGIVACLPVTSKPAQYKQCVNGKWSDTRHCTTDKPVCTDKGCIENSVQCTSGDTMCEDGKIRKCENSMWGEPKLCQDGWTCDILQNRCVANSSVRVCVEGTKKCEDMGMLTALPKRYFVCEDGRWTTETENCPDGETCRGNVGEAYCQGTEQPIADCTAGLIRCDGDGSPLFQRCVSTANGTVWSAERDKCESGVCVTLDGVAACSECTPGATRCDDKNESIKICNEQGRWVDGESCVTGKYYNKDYFCSVIEGQVDLQCVQCLTGELRCNNTKDKSVVESCNDDFEWATKKTCDKNQSCDPITAACVAKCTNNDTKCNGDAFMICRNGAWEIETTCVEGQCKAEKNGVQGCDCTEGTFTCLDDATLAVCSRTTSDAQGGKNIAYTYWEKYEDCGENQCFMPDDPKKEVPYCTCAKGSFRCKESDNSLEGCLEGKWQEVQACSKSSVCDAALGSCNTQCQKIDSINGYCSGRDRLVCNGGNGLNSSTGKLEFVETCATACNIVGQGDMSTISTCVSFDIPTAVRCSQDLRAIEVKGLTGWKVKENCSSSQVCMLQEKTVTYEPVCAKKVCEERVMGCSDDGKSITMCVNNEWKNVGSCGDISKCVKGACVLN